MQELRSTEILDKEIQEDAQKKVLKILQNAESECKILLDSIEEKMSVVQKEKEEVYAKKLQAFERNQKASIPLEKQRFEVSFMQDLLLNSINEYLENLTQEKRIQLVLKNQKIDEFVKDNKFNAFVYGFDSKKAEKELSALLGKNLISCNVTEFGKLILEEENIKLKEGIILESENKSVRFRLTLSELVSRILDKNRAELTKALLG